MVLRILKFLSLLFCLSSHSQELMQDIRDLLDPAWKIKFSITRSHSLSEGVGLRSNVEIFGKISWKVLKDFSFNSEVLLMDSRGFIQSIYDREDRKSGFHFLEAYFKWNAFPKLAYLRLGHKNQNFFKAPLLITDKTFPSLAGVIEDLPLVKDLSLKQFMLQVSVPDNAMEFIQRESQLLPDPPYFLSTSAFLEWNNLYFLEGSLQNNLIAFYFTDLPTSVAQKGIIGGNTIDGEKDDSELKHKFYGLHNTIKAKATLASTWILEVGYDYLHNFGAPDAYNQGERIFASLYHQFYELMEIKLTGAYFANQSDSSVAFYNTEVYGHNNRRGWFINLANHFYESGITLGVRYVDSQPINITKSALGNAYSFMFFIGTNYVRI